MRNISSGMCSPEFVLDALKYATKVRQARAEDGAGTEDGLHSQYSIVINLSDVNAEERLSKPTPIARRIIDLRCYKVYQRTGNGYC